MIPEEAPVLSIVIPIFNRAEFLHTTLESIRSQSFKQWECILVDDFSTDDAALVCKQFALDDPRFVFLQNSHKKGAPGARNTGILSVRSPWVILFDSDNFLHPDALKTFYTSLTEKNCDVLTCFAQVLDETGNRVSQFHWKCNGTIRQELLTGKCYVDNNLALIRTSLLLEIGLTDEDCPAYQEWDTHIRLSSFATYATIELELVDYVQTKGSISSNQHRSVMGFLYVLEKHQLAFAEYPDAHRAFGLELLETAQLTKDVGLITQVTTSLNDAIVDFGKYVQSQRRRGQINAVKHRLKTLFKRPD